MTKKILFSIALMFTIVISKAQKNVYLTITHKLASSGFAFNQSAQNDLMQNFKITRVDYYISGIKIIHDGGMIMNVPSHYILAKGTNNVMDSLGNFNVTNVEGIKFSIGVEAPTNNSDPTLYLAPHPLAPQSPSMHWGWTSGFRFIALEGTAGTGFATSFQMHGLGNANYFEQTIMTNGSTNGNDIYINLDADYTQALKGINVDAGPIDHGVNATDLTVLQNFRDFVFKPGIGFSLSVHDIYKNEKISLYPNPTEGKIYFSSTSNNQPMYALLTDMFGKVSNKINLGNKSYIELNNYAKGLYVIKFLDDRQRIMAEQKITLQ